MPISDYLKLLTTEIQQRHHIAPSKTLNTVYFGGGTPSLLSSEDIVSILNQLANVGFTFADDCEITIEINPATVSKNTLKDLTSAGVNRFSVGAQTFNDELLSVCGREHNAEDTRNTLKLLEKHDLNYSFDLLFALPGQSLEDLNSDLDETLGFQPKHLSAYCLTVPDGHSMSSNRPVEEQQVEMFSLIEQRLGQRGFEKYEISNFALPGYESKHNLLYWTDQAYWGLGLSAHSYFPNPDFGRRFWNPKIFSQYEDQAKSVQSLEQLPDSQSEQLLLHEAATDYCHTQLRIRSGIDLGTLRRKFAELSGPIEKRIDSSTLKPLLVRTGDNWALSSSGQLLSNKVFSELTFCRDDFEQNQ